MPLEKDQYIWTPEGRLFVREWHPEGEEDQACIILFHDSLGSVEQWRDFPRQLAEQTGRKVVAYDRLGFGRSDTNPRCLSTKFIREEAAAALPYICDALSIERMILFGHSVGGGMAIAAGAAFADKTDAVITLAAQAFVEDRTLAGIQEAKIAFKREGQIERLARYHGEKARWVLDAWTETWLASDFADWTLDAELQNLRCPILAMHGDRDEYGTRAHPDRIAQLAKGRAEITLLKDCYHMPHREMPEEVTRRAVRFLDTL